MFQNVSVLKIAQKMAVHAAARQNVVAQNMANADTPNYAARKLMSFQDHLKTERHAQSGALATRARHMNGSAQNAFQVLNDGSQKPDPNGNSVSLEAEMTRAADIKRQHDRALAIYKSSLDLLRLNLGRR